MKSEAASAVTGNESDTTRQDKAQHDAILIMDVSMSSLLLVMHLVVDIKMSWQYQCHTPKSPHSSAMSLEAVICRRWRWMELEMEM